MSSQIGVESRNDWLASGRHIMLRPVFAGDIPRLADLLAEAPLGIEDDPYPWTESRLRCRFEDKASPGLWGANLKLYTVASLDNQVVGYVHEFLRSTGGTVIRFHIADKVESRDTYGEDAVAVYLDMARQWNTLPRVTATALACEALKRSWLESAGFQLEVTCREGVLYEGRPQDYVVYGWVAPWAILNCVPAGAQAKELS